MFGSWCFACHYEHPILMQDGKPLGIKLVGLDCRDEPEDAKRWIAQFGNPYDVIIADLHGNVAIDFGVTGRRRRSWSTRRHRALQVHRHVHAGSDRDANCCRARRMHRRR